MTPAILGVDFTSAPRRAKPITVARATLLGDVLHVAGVEPLADWPAFEALLHEPGPWAGGFDFPFGLPRDLVRDLGWPSQWDDLVRHFAALDRTSVERTFAEWRRPRPAGQRYAHRACDAWSGAHPSMKLVNPPVAWMLHEGAPRLLAAGVHMPAVHDGDRTRVALEAYPGLLVRRIGERAGRTMVPYKSDAVAQQTPERQRARRAIVEALEAGAHDLGIAVALPDDVRSRAIADGSGDTLDAIACAVQAAWGAQRAASNYGLPARAGDGEGWIVTARPGAGGAGTC